MSDPRLDRATLLRLLADLDADLQAHGVRAELYVVGGAAMALAYDARRVTRAVDAVFRPKTEVYEAAARVAAQHPELGLDPGWLNDSVKGLLPPGADEDQDIAYDGVGLLVAVASPRHMLALKVAAARETRDGDDLLLLVKQLGLRSIAEVLDTAEAVLGPTRLTDRQHFFVTELLKDMLPAEHHGLSPLPPPETLRALRAQGLCGRLMQASGQPCRLRPGHRGRCRSR